MGLTTRPWVRKVYDQEAVPLRGGFRCLLPILTLYAPSNFTRKSQKFSLTDHFLCAIVKVLTVDIP